MPLFRAAPRKKKSGCLAVVGIAALFFLCVLAVSGPKAQQPSTPARQTVATSAPTYAPAPRDPDLPPGMSGHGKSTPVTYPRIAGKVIGITDGDTITLLTSTYELIKIRLEGIDAPEDSQEYGTRSKWALSGLIAGKTISATVTGKDRYGRTLACLEYDGININRQMVADGWAWQHLQYNQDPAITKLQADAETRRLGLWIASNDPTPPWEFRGLGRSNSSTHRSSSSQTPQRTSRSGKYWINSNGGPQFVLPMLWQHQKRTLLQPSGRRRVRHLLRLGKRSIQRL